MYTFWIFSTLMHFLGLEAGLGHDVLMGLVRLSLSKQRPAAATFSYNPIAPCFCCCYLLCPVPPFVPFCPFPYLLTDAWFPWPVGLFPQSLNLCCGCGWPVWFSNTQSPAAVCSRERQEKQERRRYRLSLGQAKSDAELGPSIGGGSIRSRNRRWRRKR